MKIKAEQHKLGNWEVFQSCTDQLPAEGVARGALSPPLDDEMRGSLGGRFVRNSVLGTASAFVKWEDEWRKKLKQAAHVGRASQNRKRQVCRRRRNLYSEQLLFYLEKPETVRHRDVSSAITLRYFKTRKAPVQTKQATGVPQHCSASLHCKETLIIPNLTFIYSSNVRGRLPGTLTMGLWSQLDPRTAAPKDPFPCQWEKVLRKACSFKEAAKMCQVTKSTWRPRDTYSIHTGFIMYKKCQKKIMQLSPAV